MNLVVALPASRGLPLRATRRPVLSKPGVAVSAALLAVAEGLLVGAAGGVARLQHAAVAAIGGHTVPAGSYLRAPIWRMATPVASLDYRALAAWAVGGAVAVWALSEVRAPAPPLRLILGYNAVLASASALVILVTGQAPYDAVAFHLFCARTQVIVWAVLPLSLGLLALGMPFRWWERLALPAVVLAYDVALSAVRAPLFGWVLAHAGAVAMAPLYLSLGPPLDVICAVGIFAVALARLGGRLAREGGEAWTWS